MEKDNYIDNDKVQTKNDNYKKRPSKELKPNLNCLYRNYDLISMTIPLK